MLSLLSEFLLILSALAVFAATTVLALQAAAALALRDRHFPSAATRPHTAVLVPAHNEAAAIAATVTDLTSQMAPGDRLLVVADNCSDQTATLALQAGAEVVVRTDPDRRGKGFALERGLNHLSTDPPDIVLFLDADCRLSSGGLEALARACAGVGGPVQCLDLMQVNPANGGQSRLPEFFWRIRNDLRPTGFARLGLPCQLFGTGMALPWSAIEFADFATSHIAEDLLIGVRCAKKGRPARFLRSVRALSYFPVTAHGSALQRRRWLHGHLLIALREAPRLFAAAVKHRSLALAALAVDLLIPPLALLGFAVGGIFALTLGFALLAGSWIPAGLAGLAGLQYTAFLTGAWWYCGRDLIGRAELAEAPHHARRVLQAATDFFVGARSGWVRAERLTPVLDGASVAAAGPAEWPEERLYTRASEMADQPQQSAPPRPATEWPGPATAFSPAMAELEPTPDFDRAAYCLLGLVVDKVTLTRTTALLRTAIDCRKRCFLSTPNMNWLTTSQTDAEFRNSIFSSDLVVVDGMPLVWLAYLLGLRLQRIAGSDLFESMMAGAAGELTVFFFGGPEGAARAASERVNALAGPMRCVGFEYPGFGSVEQMSNPEHLKKINESHPDMVSVSLGARKAQSWIMRNERDLTIPVIWHCGAVVNFAAGTVARSPALLNRLGFEWLWRIKEEPYLWRRYLNDLTTLLRFLVFRVIPCAVYQHICCPSVLDLRDAHLEVQRYESLHILRFSGSWTEQNLGPARTALREAAENRSDLILDLENLAYADAAFFGLVIVAFGYQLRMERPFAISAVSRRAKKIMRLHGCEFLLDPGKRNPPG